MHFSHASFRSILLSSTLSLHALQLTTLPCKGGGRVTSVVLPCCYHATATSHSPDRSAPPSWRQRNVQIWISFYQIRCSPVFRDLGMEENREGCVFWHLVPWNTGDTYSCIKDVQKCILHDRSPLNKVMIILKEKGRINLKRTYITYSNVFVHAKK